jgi:hypothetical protein
MDNKFLTFIKPYLSFIDSGHLYRKPFSWLYSVFGILNLLFPLYVFYMAIDNGIFDSGAKVVFLFLFLWIIIVFAGWISFQLWWDRKSKIIDTSYENDEFVATPVFSNLIQTMGEWLGTWIGIVGCCSALFTTIFLSGEEGYYFSRSIGIPFIRSGLFFIVLMPIFGFLIIVTTRFVAEQFRAITSIANNTRKHEAEQIIESNDHSVEN